MRAIAISRKYLAQRSTFCRHHWSWCTLGNFPPVTATETTVCDRWLGASCEAVGAKPAMRIIALLGLWLCLQGCSLENYAGPTAPISADLEAADDATCRSFGLALGTETYGKCRVQINEERKPAHDPAN